MILSTVKILVNLENVPKEMKISNENSLLVSEFSKIMCETVGKNINSSGRKISSISDFLI